MTAFALKIIALACMIIDHIGAVFYLDTPEFFRYIGRVSFPIFAFLIAEGCTHTKDMKKYLIRLGAFALISEIPFDLAFAPGGFPSSIFRSHIDFLYFTNVFYTLFFGALAIYFYQIIYKKLAVPNGQLEYTSSTFKNFLASAAGCLPLFPITYAVTRLGTDYSSFGVLLIFCIFIARKKTLKLFIIAAGVIYKYGAWLFMYIPFALTGNNFNILNFPYHQLFLVLFALLSVVPIYFYNGKRGRSLKWAFYVIYPAHLLLLSAVYYLM